MVEGFGGGELGDIDDDDVDRTDGGGDTDGDGVDRGTRRRVSSLLRSRPLSLVELSLLEPRRSLDLRLDGVLER